LDPSLCASTALQEQARGSSLVKLRGLLGQRCDKPFGELLGFGRTARAVLEDCPAEMERSRIGAPSRWSFEGSGQSPSMASLKLASAYLRGPAPVSFSCANTCAKWSSQTSRPSG